jgi:RES domain-containing protein
MILYRITQEQYANDLSGRGAEIHGGRWNSPGRRVVYCSTTASLALLETLAWTQLALLLKSGFVLNTIRCDSESIRDISTALLSGGWMSTAAYPETQRIGDAWLEENATLMLRVPSAVLPLESNILLNPRHPEMAHVHVADQYDLVLDPRLLGSVSSAAHLMH